VHRFVCALCRCTSRQLQGERERIARGGSASLQLHLTDHGLISHGGMAR
jgi:hypothetical protein